MYNGHMVTDEQYAEFTAVPETDEDIEDEPEDVPEEGVARPRRQRRSQKAAEAAIAQATGKALSVGSEEDKS